MDQLTRKKIIWAGMFSTTFIFILIAFVLKIPMNSTQTISTNPIIIYILFGIGFALLIISHILPKITEIKIKTRNQIEPIFMISLAINEMGSIVAFFIKMFFNSNEASLALFIATAIAFLAKFPRERENS
jgi:hypothetical protein